MIRFAGKEYYRNLWFNLCIIVLITVMMLISVTLISNVYAQTRVYRYGKKLITEDTIFISEVYADKAEELSRYGTYTAVRKYDGFIGENILVNVIVYSDEAMKFLPPSLDAGKYPDKCRKGSDTICVLIGDKLLSEGVSVGEEFELKMHTHDDAVSLKFYAAGIASSGQHLYMDMYNWSSDMTYGDFFPIFGKEENNYTTILVPESEAWKLPDELICRLNNIMLNPYEKLSDDERNEAIRELWSFDTNGSSPIYINNEDVIELSRTIYENDMMRNLPLCVVILFLFGIGLTGVIIVKTAVSIRCYGIMYIAGMSPGKAPLISGMEIGFNCIIAGILSTSLLKLQQKLKIIKAVNCSIGKAEMLFIAGICLVIIAGAVLTTKSILKKNTLVTIIRNRE